MSAGLTMDQAHTFFGGHFRTAPMGVVEEEGKFRVVHNHSALDCDGVSTNSWLDASENPTKFYTAAQFAEAVSLNSYWPFRSHLSSHFWALYQALSGQHCLAISRRCFCHFMVMFLPFLACTAFLGRCHCNVISDVFIQISNAPPGTQACALDWVKAYRCSPILRDHKWFLPSFWRNLIFPNHCAPFGLSTSGNIQGNPADAFRDILLFILICPQIFKWVDDYNIWRSPTSSPTLPSGKMSFFPIDYPPDFKTSRHYVA